MREGYDLILEHSVNAEAVEVLANESFVSRGISWKDKFYAKVSGFDEPDNKLSVDSTEEAASGPSASCLYFRLEKWVMHSKEGMGGAGRMQRSYG